MKVVLAIFLLMLCGIGSAAVTLEDGFRNPPQQARLQCYWWWLNGNITRQSISRDLEQMKQKGYGGAIIVDAGGAEQRGNDQVPQGPRYGSPHWIELFRHALETADRLGLELSLNAQSGWNLGGPTVKPEQSAKLVTFSKVTITGPAAANQPLPQPPTRAGYYEDVAVLAYPLNSTAAHKPIRDLELKGVFKEAGFSTPDTIPLMMDIPAEAGEQDAAATEVRDVTRYMSKDGRLQWDVPAGNWEILRFGLTSSGSVVSTSSESWQGLVIDHMNRDAFAKYWADVLQPVLEAGKPYVGRSLKHLVTDSWELQGVNWTSGFREQFRARRGYDPLPYVPILSGRIIENRDVSNRFLNDLRKTVGDMVAEQHYEVFADFARKYNLGIHPESGGPHGAPVDALRTLGIGAYPQMEFWARSQTHRVKDEDRFFVKEAAAASHIYAKTIVAAEGFTTIGPHWEERIWDNLKPSFDRALCEGLNLLIWHEFTSSPDSAGLPGQEYFAGTHMNPNVTWWNQSGPFLSYINRSQFLLQQGLFVADAVYYYGDHVPNFVQLKKADPAKVLPGYDYDVMNEDVLLNRTSVKDGMLILPDGTSYRVLAMPKTPYTSLAALNRIERLIHDGATVIGAAPERTTGLEQYPNGDTEVRRIASALWPADCSRLNEKKTGKGRVVCGATAREYLDSIAVKPDFEAPGSRNIDYIHRRTADADIYFISSQQESPVTINALFRVAGKAPEFWRADTGAIELPAVYEFTSDSRTRVPIQLEPYGSVFVLFRHPAQNRLSSITPASRVDTRAAGYTIAATQSGRFNLKDSTGRTYSATANVPVPRTIEGAWTVKFAPGWGAPETTIFPALNSWHLSGDAGIRYFSGTATYIKEIDIPLDMLAHGRRVELDLGDVEMLASISLNGRELGVAWKKPFAIDLTPAATPGRNKLEVRVTNLWPNRLIGDQQLPEAQRKTRTNIRKFTKDSPLLPSGLLGPVTLRSIQFVDVAR